MTKKRILEFIKKQGFTVPIFLQKTGIKRGFLDSDKLEQAVSDRHIAIINATFPELSLDWLITGRGKMLRPSYQEPHSSEIPDQPIRSRDDQDSSSLVDLQHDNAKITNKKEHGIITPVSIPLIPIEAIAGLPVTDNVGVSFADCDQYVVPEFEGKGVEFMIRVSGSSMYPKYGNGDVLACRRVYNILFFQWGKIYVIDSSQGVLVKRIFEDTNPDNVMLVSDNKEKYPPFSIPRSDIRSLSIVIGVIRLE